MNNVIVCFDYGDDGQRELSKLSYTSVFNEDEAKTIARRYSLYHDEVYFAEELPLDFVGAYLKAIIGSDKLIRIENNS